MTDDFSLNKASLRAQCLAKRLAIASADAHLASEAVAQILSSYLNDHKGVIAGYCSVRGELDILPALEQLAGQGHILCLPVVEVVGKPLIFCSWKPGEALVKEAYGISVPSNRNMVLPDIIIAPLLAFDRAGHRLGYGAGYYDHTLAQLRQTKPKSQLIGVGCAVQCVAHIPAQAHDIRLDKVITEQGIMDIT